MIHLIYKISSNFSNDFYIGRKTVKKLSQFNNYWSSSKKFKKFVLDNGKNNFTKQILFEFDNEQEQVEKENYFNLDLYKNDLDCWSRGSFTGMKCESIRDFNNKRVADGNHPFLGGEIQRKRIAEGTHNLLGENNPVNERVKNGTHNFLGGEMSRKISRKRVADGTHNFLGENNPSHMMIAEGTHHFLGENNPSHKRVADGTHNFLGGKISRETQRKRIAEGTHNFLKNKGTIWVCNTEGAYRIHPEQLDDYLARGYQKGLKLKA